jgi:peptide/nickel transport system substrate-binding protein
MLPLVALLLLLAACGGGQPAAPAEEAAAPAEAAPTEAAKEEAPAAEAPAAEAAPATEGAYGPMPADTIPFPAPPELDLGGTAVEPIAIDQMMAYKALPEYHEPEWVTALVDEGKLPPVAERLPKEPKVILAAGMVDGVGVYGDVWRDFSACPTAGWNNGAGVTSGWFGIESMSFNYQALVKTGPLYRANQDIEPIPNLAKSWEWSEDGKQLTMHLIEGAKWSDGDPFDAEDVIFTWEDLINDPQVVRMGSKGDGWNTDGQPTTLEMVDPYTIKFTFAASKPLEKYYIMDEGDFNISPSHILKPLHPKYNTDMDYKEFADALPPDLLPAVTLGPWVPVEYKTDELLIMRRNPYFWTVDEEGNQLPYIDEAVYKKGPTGAGRTECTIAGGCDHTNVENPSSEYLTSLQAAAEPDAEFKMNWGPEDLAFNLELNQSETLGLKDDRDTAVRALFREDKFRQAVSHALDRDGIAQSIFRGPLLRAFPGGLFPGSPEFDPASVVYYGFDVEKSKALLAELGLTDSDNNGILNFPADGPGAGQDLVFGLNSYEDQAEGKIVADQIVVMLNAVGIKINARPFNSQTMTDLNQSGEWDLRITRPDDYLLPFTTCNNLGPITPQTPGWNRQGASERVLRDWEQQIADKAIAYCAERDPAARKQLINEWNYLWTYHNYSIGTVIGRKGLALAKRFKNVPGGIPARLYQWVEDAIMSEIIWTPVEEHKEQVRPNVIPEYGQ